MRRRLLAATLEAPALLSAQTAPLSPMTPDMLPVYDQVRPTTDYIRREASTRGANLRRDRRDRSGMVRLGTQGPALSR